LRPGNRVWDKKKLKELLLGYIITFNKSKRQKGFEILLSLSKKRLYTSLKDDAGHRARRSRLFPIWRQPELGDFGSGEQYLNSIFSI